MYKILTNNNQLLKFYPGVYDSALFNLPGVIFLFAPFGSNQPILINHRNISSQPHINVSMVGGKPKLGKSVSPNLLYIIYPILACLKVLITTANCQTRKYWDQLTLEGVNLLTLLIFTESAHWADSVIELHCPYVCVCVCLCVCMSPPSEIYFRAFLPPLTKVLGLHILNFWIS